MVPCAHVERSAVVAFSIFCQGIEVSECLLFVSI